MKKAQGLPLNLIVLAIIAAIILILVIAFTVGGAGTTFSRIGKAGVGATGEEIDTIRNNCRQACSTAQSTVTNGRQWVQTRYCQMSSSIDVDASGSLDKADEKNIKCWKDPIKIGCAFTLEAGGTTKKIDLADGDARAGCTVADVVNV